MATTVSEVRKLEKRITRLAGRDRYQLFRRLETHLEDYLLTKIAESRAEKDSGRRIAWATLRRRVAV